MNTTIPPRFEGLQPYTSVYEQIEKKKQSVLLFGFGALGKQVFNVLKNRHIPVAAILDNNPCLQNTEYQNIPVLLPENYPAHDTPVILCLRKGYGQALGQLNRLGFQNTIPYTLCLLQQKMELTQCTDMLLDWRKIQYAVEQHTQQQIDTLVLDSVDFVVTEKCSLRCKDCANLIQYFKNPQHANSAQLIQSFDHLMQAVDYTHEIRVLGGEPLMNPKLPLYIEKIKQYQNYGSIIIYTNATILPNPLLLQQLDDDRIIFYISDYGNPKQKISEWEQIVQKRQIAAKILQVQEWQDCAQLQPFHRTSRQNREIFEKCCVHNTTSIKEGQLFRCPLAGNISALHAAPVDFHESVDLLSKDISLMRRQIQQMLALPYLRVCDFCGGRPEGINNIPAAIQVPHPLPYKRYEE